MFDAPMRGIAGHLAQQGRYGDTTLVHMNPMEVQALASLSPTGQLTTNPVTGQPEAFFLSGLGSFLGNAIFGKFLGPQLASVLGSAATTGLVTGDFKKGIMAGISGYGFGNAISEAMKAGASAEVAEEMAAAEAADAANAPVDNSTVPEYLQNQPSGIYDPGPQIEFGPAETAAAPEEMSFFERFKQPFSSKEGIGAFMSSLGKPGAMLPIYVGEGNIAAMDAMKARKRYAKKLGADRENELRRARMGLYGALQGIQRDYPGLGYTYGQGYAHGGQIKKMAKGKSTEDEVPDVILPDPISVQAGLRGATINTPPPVDYSALHQGGSGYMPGLAPEFMYFGSGTGGGGNSGVLPPPGGGGTDGGIFGGNQPSPGTAGPVNPYDLGGLLNMYFNSPYSDQEEIKSSDQEDQNVLDNENKNIKEESAPSAFDMMTTAIKSIIPTPPKPEELTRGVVKLATRFNPYTGAWELLSDIGDWTGLYDMPPIDEVILGPLEQSEEQKAAQAAGTTTTAGTNKLPTTSSTPTTYTGGGLNPSDLQSADAYLAQKGVNTNAPGSVNTYVQTADTGPILSGFSPVTSNDILGGMSWEDLKIPVDEFNLESEAFGGGLTTRHGVKRYQEGGPVMMDEPVDSVSNMEMMLSDMEQPETIDPRSEYDQLVNMTVAAIKGEIEEGADQIIEAFVAEYGPEAFAQLREAVLKQIVPGAQTEGLIDGNGGGMDDEVDGMIGSEQRVAVSPGEYIIPADVVSGLGDGSTDAGASILDEMLDSIRMARTGTTKQPEPLFS